MQWTHSISLKHLNNDDPSGHLSLSIGLIEQLRNSIYTDLALRIKESSLQTLKCRANQAGRQILKEPPLVGSQQVKDHVFQSEPTGLISLASHANFEEQPEGDLSHLSSSEQQYLGSISISPLASGCCGVSHWCLVGGNLSGERKRRMKSKLRLL